MASPEAFEDLDAWKQARELTNAVYQMCRTDPFSRDYGLSDQLRRAALSVMNNLAEGWESVHQGEKIQSYNYARRSCGEVRSMSYVLEDNPLAPPPEIAARRARCIRTGKLVSGLIRSISR